MKEVMQAVDGFQAQHKDVNGVVVPGFAYQGWPHNQLWRFLSMTELEAVWQVPEARQLPQDGDYLYCRINAAGGISYFESLANLVAFDAGCRDDEAVAAVAMLRCIGEEIMVVIGAQTAVKEWEEHDRCNGREEVRGNGVVYAVHTAGVDCPLHGLHADPSKRLAKYVGTDEVKVAALRGAMACYKLWDEARDYLRVCEVNAEKLAARVLGLR